MNNVRIPIGTINMDIVTKKNKFVKKSSKDVVHGGLKCCRGIAQSKGND